jgi:hypothetical protein
MIPPATTRALNYLSYAGHLNNQGVRFVQSNNFSVATLFFRTALTVLKNRSTDFIPPEAINGDLRHLINVIAASVGASVGTDFEDFVQTEHRQQELIAENLRSTTTPGDINYYVYMQGLMLDDSIQDDSQELMIATYTGTALFNLALSHHKHGCYGSESMLARSLILYYDCASYLDESLHIMSNSCYSHVQAVLYNNIAHIHLINCDYVSFNSSLRKVASEALRSMSVLKNVANFPMTEIVLNLFMLRVSPIACAA